jgi:hypothetical protein
MSAPFAPGDVVVCEDARPCAFYPEATVPVQGAVYRIVQARDFHDPNTGNTAFAVQLDRDNCVLRGKVGWYNHNRFRKIEAPDTEVARRIKAAKPAPAKPSLNPARHSRERA